MTDEQAKLMGEAAGAAFAKELIKWIQKSNHNYALSDVEWLLQKFGAAIGRSLGEAQKGEGPCSTS